MYYPYKLILVLFKYAITICHSELDTYFTSLAKQFSADKGIEHLERLNGNDTAVMLHRLVKEYHEYKLRWYFGKRKNWTTSNLGSLMFKNDPSHDFKSKNKTLIIFFWKLFYLWFKSRHMARHLEDDPLYECSVKNCIVTDDEALLHAADAVVVHAQYGILPRVISRKPSQIWVFLSDESPKNVFSASRAPPFLDEWANIFNWTMTYRTDSDVPIPYGRTLPQLNYLSPKDIPNSIEELIPYWKRKRRDVLIAVLMSSCLSRRMKYIKKLQEYMKVDVFGKCSQNNKNSCPGRWVADCPILNNYVFYLAFENSSCRQYITEKTFHNAFAKGAIPIIMGAPRGDCQKLLPTMSYIHVDDFATPGLLSNYIRRINMNEERLLAYHQWRRFFKVTNEHGYLGTRSSAACRLCEALNYNDRSPKVYNEDDLKLFFDYNLLCGASSKQRIYF